MISKLPYETRQQLKKIKRGTTQPVVGQNMQDNLDMYRNSDLEEVLHTLLNESFNVGEKAGMEKAMAAYAGKQLSESELVAIFAQTFINEILSLKKCRQPTHGSCCTCQTCGYPFDECECSENSKYDGLVSLLTSKYIKKESGDGKS